tara:strand:+ start:1271 stop:1495 length:225 start_codon:yes stop_codon:yes gene_type:complete
MIKMNPENPDDQKFVEDFLALDEADQKRLLSCDQCGADLTDPENHPPSVIVTLDFEETMKEVSKIVCVRCNLDV